MRTTGSGGLGWGLPSVQITSASMATQVAATTGALAGFGPIASGDRWPIASCAVVGAAAAATVAWATRHRAGLPFPRLWCAAVAMTCATLAVAALSGMIRGVAWSAVTWGATAAALVLFLRVLPVSVHSPWLPRLGFVAIAWAVVILGSGVMLPAAGTAASEAIAGLAAPEDAPAAPGHATTRLPDDASHRPPGPSGAPPMSRANSAEASPGTPSPPSGPRGPNSQGAPPSLNEGAAPGKVPLRRGTEAPVAASPSAPPPARPGERIDRTWRRAVLSDDITDYEAITASADAEDSAEACGAWAQLSKRTPSLTPSRFVPPELQGRPSVPPHVLHGFIDAVLDVRVGRQGVIESARVVRGGGDVAEELERAVQQWSYRPARQGGNPIPCADRIVLRTPSP